MNFWIHLAIAVILTAYFLFRFVKDKQIYQLLFVIWVPSTLLTYVFTSRPLRIALVIFQVIMFVLVLFFMFKKPNQPAATDDATVQEAVPDALPDNSEEDGQTAEEDIPSAEEVPEEQTPASESTDPETKE